MNDHESDYEDCSSDTSSNTDKDIYHSDMTMEQFLAGPKGITIPRSDIPTE